MYSVIDIESNGAGFRKESIIEIAIYRYNGHEITDRFISLVNPESDITPFVQKLTHISPKMVKTAPKFHEIAKRIIEITAGTTLVGHNIDFDYRMLRQEFKRLGYDFESNTIDTIPLAKKLIPEAESYSLGKLVKSIGIPLTDQHRAGGDARATLDLFKILMSKDQSSEIIQQHRDEVNSKTYLSKVRDLSQDLPAERGLIYFQNPQGKIIYYDFVDDMNKFAKSVFHSKSKRWKKIQEETEHISYELTGNRIIAKLITQTKGLRKREALPFGLYHKNGKYFADKISSHKGKEPLLKFKSFTQGLKAVAFIKNNNQYNDLAAFTAHISMKKRNELWTSAGRTLGEKSFFVVENGKLKAYGFYEFHTQIQTRKKIDQLKINVATATADVKNELQLGLLRGDFEVMELPK